MIKLICIREEDNGPMEPLDEDWKLLSGSSILTLKPALSSATPALMDICDHCLHTCYYETLEVAVHCKEAQCMCTHHSFWYSDFCTHCLL